MEQYSHKSFNNFVAELEPNPDDVALIEQIVENSELRQSLLDWIAGTTAQRMKDIKQITPDNLLDVVLHLKGAELLDVYVMAFTAGRYYEKRARNEFEQTIGKTSGDSGTTGDGPSEGLRSDS